MPSLLMPLLDTQWPDGWMVRGDNSKYKTLTEVVIVPKLRQSVIRQALCNFRALTAGTTIDAYRSLRSPCRAVY